MTSRTCFQCEESELLINDKRNEIDRLRTQLVKAEKVIKVAIMMHDEVPARTAQESRVNSHRLFNQLGSALYEYNKAERTE